MRYVFITFLISSLILSMFHSDAQNISQMDYLKVDGLVVRNGYGKGDTIQLKGINLGGWLLREGWMDPIGFDSINHKNGFLDDFTSRKMMSQRFGASTTDKMLDVYQQFYIQKSDLDLIKSLGLNFVRVPIYWQEIMDHEGDIKKNGFKEIDWVIRECKVRGLYVLLDLHGAPGGHSDGYLTGGHEGSNELWTNPNFQIMTIKIWRTIAKRYSEEPTLLGYDLLNEPVASQKGKLTISDMYDILYHVVREVDEQHIIFIGAFKSFEDICNPIDKKWENVIYESHHYFPFNKTDKIVQKDYLEKQVKIILEYQNKWHVPIYAGEYNFWNNYDLWELWMKSLNNENVMWSSWCYKSTDVLEENSWGIYYSNQCAAPNLLTDSKKNIIGKWQKFTSENYQINKGLMDVISKCAKENY